MKIKENVGIGLVMLVFFVLLGVMIHQLSKIHALKQYTKEELAERAKVFTNCMLAQVTLEFTGQLLEIERDYERYSSLLIVQFDTVSFDPQVDQEKLECKGFYVDFNRKLIKMIISKNLVRNFKHENGKEHVFKKEAGSIKLDLYDPFHQRKYDSIYLFQTSPAY